MRKLHSMLCLTGLSACDDLHCFDRLREMRALYEGYAAALSEFLCMPLPPWIADQPHKDNWLAVARLRDQTEAAQSLPDRQSPADRVSNTIESLVDKHHEF